MKAVLFGTLVDKMLPALRHSLRTPYQLTLLGPSATAGDRAAALAEASVAITMEYTRQMPPMPRLRLLQAPVAGTDKIDTDALPATATVCNVYEHEASVAEHTLLCMLAWQHRFLEAEASFRGGDWRLSSRTDGELHGELCGTTVGIIGYGRIGRALAARLAPFGVRILACTRSPGSGSAEHVDAVFGMDRLDDVLGECDFVVAAYALTTETTGLIDAGRIARMRPGAVLVNIARGECVDEDALYTACREGSIGGAIIDTWYRYPRPGEAGVRPSRHPFHELGNVIMTPHSSAWSTGVVQRRAAAMADNLDRLAAGAPLLNVVRHPLSIR